MNNKILFETTLAQQIKLIDIVVAMLSTKPELTPIAAKLALVDQGVFDLMELWYSQNNEFEKEKTIDTIKESVKDWTRYEFDLLY